MYRGRFLPVHKLCFFYFAEVFLSEDEEGVSNKYTNKSLLEITNIVLNK